MFINIENTKDALEDPLYIFQIIEDQNSYLLEEILNKNFDFNLCDKSGNNVLMSLLINKEYDLVLKYMNLKSININHQNNFGDTFGHILYSINYTEVIDIINKLNKNDSLLPNIKNNKGETLLDRAISKESIYPTIKILEDDRFSDINMMSFKKLYNTYFKNEEYGEYSKMVTLNLIIDKDDKVTNVHMRNLLSLLKDNKEIIEDEITEGKLTLFDEIISKFIRI